MLCPNVFRGRKSLSLIVVLTTAFVLPSAHGAPKRWTGAINGNLNTPGNWSPAGVPAAGDDLIFQPPPVTRLLVTNDFSPNRAFNSITFEGSNYFLRGNALLLTNGITTTNLVGANHIDADVSVRASQFWEAHGPLASLDVNGDISLNANTLTVRANTGDFFFSGVISGTGSLVKTNVGTLRLDGSRHNTYTGLTRFDGGVLELSKFAIIPMVTNFTAIPGNLTIGDGNGLVGTDVLRLLRDDQIADNSEVTIRNSGLFDLNNNSDRIGPLEMRGGELDSGTGTLILGGDLTTMADANTAFINGNLSLGGTSRTFNVQSGPPGADLRINATVSAGTTTLFATAGFTKTGGGSLFLAGTNTYNGITTIDEGQVALLADRALGAVSTPLGASARTVVNGSGNLFLSGVQVTNEDLTINGANPGGAFNASGASVWTGDILLNIDTFIASSGGLLLNGQITGAGGFTKLSGGSVTLGGTNANTYTGTTTVRDGTLLLEKLTTAPNDDAMSGPLVIGEDELPENTDVVRYLACCQLPDDTDITVNASGLLDLNGFGDNISDMVFNGGDVDAPSPGSILPSGNITVNRNTNSQAIISGRMSVLSSPIIDVTGHFFSPDLSITAVLFGAGNLTKNGVGEVGLNGANTYSGLTTVNDGFLVVNNSSALGTTAGGTVVNSGAVLALNFGVDVPAEALSLAGTGQSGFGALASGFGSNSWAGNITLTSNATISVDAGDVLNLLGSITGGFDITKTDTGALWFSGGTANSFDDMFVSGGTLVLNKSIANGAGPADLTIGDLTGTDIVRLQSDNQIADTTQVHISSTGRFDLNDNNETTGAIDGRGQLDLGSGTLRAGADNDSSSFSGLIIGTGSLFKLGTGTWTLTGDNTYSGQTTVSAGTLAVEGSQPQSPVTVNGTANVAGSGVIGNLQVFGSVRPGTSPGILTSSNVSFAAQGDFFVELNGSTPGTGYDQLNVRGTNQLGGSTLHVSVGPDFAPAEGDRMTIINNDGSEAIQGTFGGLPNGAVLNAGGLQFRILYSDIFVNDVILVVTNTALKLGLDPIVETGNGNPDIEPGECNLLRIPLMNKITGIVSGVSATLSSTNPGVTITQPFSAYPNLPSLGTRTNTTPFQISTSADLPCGTNIFLTLTVATATNGTFKVPVRVYIGSAGVAQRFNNNADLAIPDVGMVDSTINVAGFVGPIGRVVVSLHITHTAVSDLDLSLVGPDGTIIDLSSDNGGSNNDYGTGEADADRTTFDDLAPTAITSGTAPFRGRFRPEQALSAFRGLSGSDANGTWRLRMNDDAGGALGTLRAWSLFLSPTICTPGGGECEECGGPIIGSISASDAVQVNRLTRENVLPSCVAPKACPGVGGVSEPVIYYDAYTFTNVGGAACVTVSLQSPCDDGAVDANHVHSAAYLGSYDPANKCLNYLADSGVYEPSRTYSFAVPPTSVFVVIVSGTDSGETCTNYTLRVTGFDCPQRLDIEPVDATHVALQWSTSAVGYQLLSAPNSDGAPPHFTPTGAEPFVIGGKYTVTNDTSGQMRLYELGKP
ncbi:MAG: autotransporter-associated beta strand repeat-containing protein [Verrucomicrobia subdivision 3 bacterium]|nr:autotransporter-associated beta strand repeat-containing protein [Limisphaerales bacterium]